MSEKIKKSYPISTKTHVAVLAAPGLGHVIPLFEFSKGLVTDHHFHVTFLVINTTEPSPAQDHLLNSSTLPSHLDVVHFPTVDVSTTIPDPDTPLLTQISFIVQESFKSLKIIMMERLSYPLHTYVGDIFTSKAFDIVKEIRDIPVYTFFTTSAAFLAFSLYFPTLDKEVEGEIVDQPGPVLVSSCSPVRTDDLLDQVRSRKSEDYKWFLWHMNRLAMADGILLNTWEELERVSLRAIRENRFYLELPAPPVYLVGPVMGRRNDQSEVLTETDVNCVAWLNKQPSELVLFICLGSGGTLTAQQIGEMAWGLELSRQRFLWVVRKPTGATTSGRPKTMMYNFNVCYKGYFSCGPKTNYECGSLERVEGIVSDGLTLSVLKEELIGCGNLDDKLLFYQTPGKTINEESGLMMLENDSS